MIICRTPMRISFIGGGSDLPSFYERHGGRVVSTSINKFMYLTVKNKFDSGIRASYSITEEVEKASDLQHPLIRAAMALTGVDQRVELASMADVPKGTGLGSSSSFTVCLLHALNTLKGKAVTPEYLAREAAKIEIEICGEPIGKQDQYAAAYGGLNDIAFDPGGTVSVKPVISLSETQKKLSDHIMLFYTGVSRSASSVLNEQNAAIKNTQKSVGLVREIAELCEPFLTSFRSNDFAVMGEILDESWKLKRQITKSISNTEIDRLYEKGCQAGAYGGKLLGAGNGGFLMFLVHPEKQQDVRNIFNTKLREMPVEIHEFGSQIIFHTETEIGWH